MTSTTGEPSKHFGTAAAWRAWLARNHATSPRLWVVFYKKHTARKQMSYEQAVQEALCFGWIDSLVRRLDDDSYMQLFTPRRSTSKWSASNRARLRELVAEGRMTDAGFAKLGDALSQGADSKPPAAEAVLDACLEDLLRRNQEASRKFDRLAPSLRKQYIRWVMAAKKPETRERRLREAIGKLEKGEPLGLK